MSTTTQRAMTTAKLLALTGSQHQTSASVAAALKFLGPSREVVAEALSAQLAISQLDRKAARAALEMTTSRDARSAALKVLNLTGDDGNAASARSVSRLLRAMTANEAASTALAALGHQRDGALARVMGGSLTPDTTFTLLTKLKADAVARHFPFHDQSVLADLVASKRPHPTTTPTLPPPVAEVVTRVVEATTAAAVAEPEGSDLDWLVHLWPIMKLTSAAWCASFGVFFVFAEAMLPDRTPRELVAIAAIWAFTVAMGAALIDNEVRVRRQR